MNWILNKFESANFWQLIGWMVLVYILAVVFINWLLRKWEDRE